jgi:hypothetical protein
VTFLSTINKVLLVSSFLWLLLSFWNRNEIPSGVDYGSELTEEPSQRRTRKRPFQADYAGVTYQINPQYEYDLYGMIVSYRHHDGESTMHRMSNDHLNAADLCVVWGDNLDADVLSRLKFWNGIFTCNVSTSDMDAWSRFEMNQLSNNHLISADEVVREQIDTASVGDQVRIKGWLASYGAVGGPTRGTSTTRTDTGNGACETIFVDDFAVVASPFRPWRAGLWTSAIVLLLSLALHFMMPYRVTS